MKKAQSTCVVIIVCLCILLCSCPTQGNANNIRVRVIIESSKTAVADIKIFVEGASGNIISGALVIVSNSSNTVETVMFDPNKSCYFTKSEIPADGLYSIKVNSLASSKTIELKVPHTFLKTAPTITLFRDAAGKSVLAGEKLSAGSAVQLAWDPVFDDAGYLVTIKTALETVFQKSTKMTQMSILADLLTPNTTYFVQIQAQKIHGDPLFKNEAYYSVSVNTSAGLSFAVE